MGLPAITSSTAVFKALPARTARTAAGDESAQAGAAGAASSASSSPATSGNSTKAAQVQQQVRTLEQTDQKVRAHEQAHQAAGGPHAGGASFTYQKGPDGKNYAVAGEVPIDISREATPDATISKMDTVKAAALAPADPSSQDRAVAQQADALKLQAQQEKNKETASAGNETAVSEKDGNGTDGGQRTQGNPEAQGNQGQGDRGQGDRESSRTAPAALAARGAAAYGAAASFMQTAAPTLALSA